MNEPTYGELIEISVDKISPHRDNPRKNLGDLTELSDSIRMSTVEEAFEQLDG